MLNANPADPTVLDDSGKLSADRFFVLVVQWRPNARLCPEPSMRWRTASDYRITPLPARRFDRAALYQPDNFQRRAEVIDAIAFEIIDRIDGLLGYPSQPRKLRSLRHAAERLMRRLQVVDERVFQDLRSLIRGGCRGEPLRHLIERLVGVDAAGDRGQASVGYDRLDRLVTGLLDNGAFPEPRLHPEPEMVLYQRTPARMCIVTTARPRRSRPGRCGLPPPAVSGRPITCSVICPTW